MRKIYIRHADKAYKNMESEFFKHDPGITMTGVERSISVAKRLVEEYGEPSKIVSSPFRRARETAMIMNTVLKNPLEEILIDNNLSEYLGNHNHVPLDVTTATSIHNPPHPESFDDMKKRVKRHIEKIRKKSSEKETIWFVTHGLILKQVASSISLKTTRTFPCLTCLSIVETPDMVKGEFILFQGKLKHEKESEEMFAVPKIKNTKNKITRILQKF